VSRAQLVGTIDNLRDFCQLKWKDDQQYNANSDESAFGTILKTDLCMVNDAANALLMIPMDVFRGTDRVSKRYITQHPVFQHLTQTLYGSANVKLNIQNFHWNQIAFRPRKSFPARGRDAFEHVGGSDMYSRELPDWVTSEAAAEISSCGSVYYMNNLPEPDFMTDSSFGTLAVVVCYPDCIDINFPGGKRELGETPYDNVLREVFEETGLRLTEEFSVQNTSSNKLSDKTTMEVMEENNTTNNNLPNGNTTMTDSSLDPLLVGMMEGLALDFDQKVGDTTTTTITSPTKTTPTIISPPTATASVKSFRWTPAFNFNPRLGTDKFMFLLENASAV
jgi:8-oxo-dGTP pyrophosphatase MutT (NUDIX family)